MSAVTLTDANFESEVLKSNLPVLVDFWAEWCHPCHMIAPIVAELAKEYEGKLRVGKMDVDANATTPPQHGIMSLPTLAVFKNGQVVKTIIGAQSKENIKKGIEEVIGS